MKEMWRGVKGFEEYIEISNFGNIRRIKVNQRVNNNEKIEMKVNRKIKATIDRGYYKVALSINGKRYLRYVHRMVAEAFIPNPNNYKEVNHIDSNPSNNCVENLEWCDRKYNIKYMINHQEEIKDRHERRIEMLENIYYGIELGLINNVEQVKDIIDEKLLNEY